MSKRSYPSHPGGHSGSGGFSPPSRTAGFFVSLKSLFFSDGSLPMVPPQALPEMKGGHLRTLSGMPRASTAHRPLPAPETRPTHSLRRVAGSAGRWKKRLAEAKATWPKATVDELIATDGHLIKLADLIQERYGLSRDAAELQVRRFLGPHDAGTDSRPRP